MTSLATRKTRLVVEFSDTVRERGKSREVVMHMTEYGIAVRLKGTRKTFTTSPAAVYGLAVRQTVDEARRLKKAAKKEAKR